MNAKTCPILLQDNGNIIFSNLFNIIQGTHPCSIFYEYVIEVTHFCVVNRIVLGADEALVVDGCSTYCRSWYPIYRV